MLAVVRTTARNLMRTPQRSRRSTSILSVRWSSSRHGHGQVDQERERSHVDGEGAIDEGSLQRQANELACDGLHAVLRDGMARDVLAEGPFPARSSAAAVVAACNEKPRSATHRPRTSGSRPARNMMGSCRRGAGPAGGVPATPEPTRSPPFSRSPTASARAPGSRPACAPARDPTQGAGRFRAGPANPQACDAIDSGDLSDFEPELGAASTSRRSVAALAATTKTTSSWELDSRSEHGGAGE